MADIKISELTAVSSLNNGDLVEVSQVNELAPSGYTSLKATMRDLGDKVNTDIEYTTDLADFTDKTTLGAIKETAKGKNIADEYDDTQTYNKGDVVIYKNTLYICTTNNTTGTWDATKWTATTVQSLIGPLSSLTTTNKDSLVDAVNEVNGKVNCALITQTRLTSDYTLTSNTATRVFDDGTANLSAGNYIFEVTFPAIWSSASGVIHGGIRVDGTYSESSMIYGPQEVGGLITFKGSINISSAGNHTIGSAIRTDSGKTVTIKSYVSATVTLWRV